MARDYAAEYRARELRARQSGFADYDKPYAEERRQREAVSQQQEADRIAGKTGMQGPFTSVQVDEDWEQISPTRSSYSEGPNNWHPELRTREDHRRTLGARYNKKNQRMEVMYAANGYKADAAYYFEGVPPNVWQQFKRHWSPGRYLYYYIDLHYGQGLTKKGRTCGLPLPGGFNNIIGEGK